MTPDVVLRRSAGGLEAEIGEHLRRPGATYAFYLHHNGKRVATRWYGDAPAASFELPGPPIGRFHAYGFVRTDGADSTQRFRSGTLVLADDASAPIEPPAVCLGAAAPVTLHIGLPKTGTTYLQNSFHKAFATDADAPIGYPDAGFYNHQVALYRPLGRFLPWTVRPTTPAPWATLREHLGRPDGPRFLLSAEALSALSAEGVAAFRTLLGDRPVARIIVTVRPLPKLLPSHWQQNMKQGGRGRLDAYAERILATIDADQAPAQMFCVASTLRLWRAVFAEVPVSVLVMDGGHEQNLLAFARLCGLGAEHDARLLASVPTAASEQNLSFSLDECMELLQINEKIARGELPLVARREAMDRFYKAREQGGAYERPSLSPAHRAEAERLDARAFEQIARDPACAVAHGRDQQLPATEERSGSPAV